MISGCGEATKTVLVIGVSIGVISTELVMTTTGTLAGPVAVIVSIGDGGTVRLVSVAGQMVVYSMIVLVWIISEVREYGHHSIWDIHLVTVYISVVNFVEVISCCEVTCG